MKRRTADAHARPLPRVVCVVGPTSSGKTALGIHLAQRFQGEVVNADARQVYRHVDIGTGKPSKGKRAVYEHQRVFMVEGVPHHLMDVVSPSKTFTVAEWRKKALTMIRRITHRQHLPFIVGGTGLYIQSMIDNYRIPEVPPQPAFRDAMASKSLDELVTLLRQLDPTACSVVDLKNTRRVLRALEVVTFTGKSFTVHRRKGKPLVEALMLAPYRSKEELHHLIATNVDRMIERGWLDEIRRLRKDGVHWDDPAMTSIGYRELGAYLRHETTLEQAIEQVKQATRQYAKRQMTWFKRDTRIHWVKDVSEAERLVADWLATGQD